MGEPGVGAEEQASRRARRVARLREEAARGDEAERAALDRALADQRAWTVGAEGERQVAQMLARLGRFGWTALHDVHWPGRPYANIDHIAIGPGGIVVIDAKNWSGSVMVRDGVLRQNGHRRDGQVEGVAQATAAVTAELAAQHRTATRAVLCLAGQDQEPCRVEGVDVVGRWQLPDLLLALPARLTPYDVADVARFLSRRLDQPGQQAPTQRSPSRKPAAARRPASSGRGRATTGRSLGRSLRRALTRLVVGLTVAAAGWVLAMMMLRAVFAQLAG